MIWGTSPVMRPSTQGMTLGLFAAILGIVALAALVWFAAIAPATNP